MRLQRRIFGFQRQLCTQKGVALEASFDRSVVAGAPDLCHLESIRFVVSNLPRHSSYIDALIQRVTSIETLSRAVGIAEPHNFFVVECVSPQDANDYRRSVFDVRLTVSPSFDAPHENSSQADAKWSLACAKLFQELTGKQSPVTLVHRALRREASGYQGHQHGMTLMPGCDELAHLWEYYSACDFKAPREYPTRRPGCMATLYPLLIAP